MLEILDVQFVNAVDSWDREEEVVKNPLFEKNWTWKIMKPMFRTITRKVSRSFREKEWKYEETTQILGAQ